MFAFFYQGRCVCIAPQWARLHVFAVILNRLSVFRKKGGKSHFAAGTD
jgi:hypothetical protein